MRAMSEPPMAREAALTVTELVPAMEPSSKVGVLQNVEGGVAGGGERTAEVDVDAGIAADGAAEIVDPDEERGGGERLRGDADGGVTTDRAAAVAAVVIEIHDPESGIARARDCARRHRKSRLAFSPIVPPPALEIWLKIEPAVRSAARHREKSVGADQGAAFAVKMSC